MATKVTTVEFERYFEANKIITLCMSAHVSHLLQPLDVGCFGPLKKAYGREIEHLIRSSVHHISKTEFFPALVAVFQATMTEKNIRGAFRGATDSNASREGGKPGSALDFKDTKDSTRGRISV
jgi:hypothetical protein